MSIVRIDDVDYHTEEDGVTHINVYSGSRTELGQFWSNFTASKTMTPHGVFESLEGYYHFLKITRSLSVSGKYTDRIVSVQDEMGRLKALSGKAAQLLGRDLRKRLASAGIYTLDIPDDWFNSNFKEALVNKLNDNPVMRERTLENDLPLTHYYAMGKNVFYKPHFKWLVEQIYAVIEDTEYLVHAGTRKRVDA